MPIDQRIVEHLMESRQVPRMQNWRSGRNVAAFAPPEAFLDLPALLDGRPSLTKIIGDAKWLERLAKN